MAPVEAPIAPAPSGRPSPAPERRLGRLLIAAAVGALILVLPRPEAVEPQGWRLLAIFVATIVGIVTRPLPMGAIAMIAIGVTILSGTLDLEQVLDGFSNDVVWLVVSAFLLAGTFIRTGLGRRIAYVFMSQFGHRTLGLAYSLAATDFVLAPVIPSHTARSGGVVFPIVQSLARSAFGSTERDDVRRTAGFLTFATFQSTVVISGMFMTSMGANPLVVALAGQQGVEITWGQWALAAIVPGLVSLTIVPLIIYRLYPPAIRHTPDARLLARAELDRLGPMRREERILVAVFVGLIVAWSFGASLGIESAASALAALGVLLLTGVLTWDDVAREHEAWSTFVWFAVLVMLATELGEFGIPRWLGETVTGALGDVRWGVGFLVLSLAYFYSHYFFASNTAHITAMYAPFLVVALALGTPPLLAAFVLAFFSNLFGSLTHYGAAAAPVFFGAGFVPVTTWWKIGGLLSLVNITVWLVVGGLWWKLLGIW
jgi:DASS family divalent anion:Na+ symporter